MTIVEGRIEKILPVERPSEKFTKQVVVVNNGAKFNPTIPCLFTQQFVDDVPGFKVGDAVRVQGFLEGREWNGKYFLEFKANKIELQSGGRPEVAPLSVESIKSGGPSFESETPDPFPF